MASSFPRVLLVVVLAVVGLAAPVRATADASKCGRTSWSTLTGAGLPAPMAHDGWGDCPSSTRAMWWGRWSYPDYPLLCVPASSPEPAWEFIWVTDQGQPKVPLVTTHPWLVRRAVRRAVSVFAASRNSAIRDRSDLAVASTPRIVTFRGRNGRCQPLFRRVTVPHDVLLREPYQNWTDPETGQLELGLWPWLESHGFPSRDDRRYITVTDTRGVWNFLGGATIVPCSGSGYGPADLQPGAQNCNQKGGTWMTLSTDGGLNDFRANATGSFGERLAHEFAHGMGAVVEGSPHANPDNPGHPSDCADLLCYNNVAQPGQDYDRCGGSPGDTWRAYLSSDANTSRASYRLDCGRDDYYAYVLRDGVLDERAWAAERWAGEDDRFYWGGVDGYQGPSFSNLDYRVPPACTYDPTGWCPPRVGRTTTTEARPPGLWAVR